MRVVIAAVDGSAPAAAASRWAARIARRFDADLLLANAWEPTQAEGTDEDFAERRAAAARLLQEAWSAPAREAGVVPRTVLVDGPPEHLLKVADAESSDLLVVGSRGLGGPAQLHVGSTAHHLAHHTSRPLAIVPLPAAERPPTTIVLGVDGGPGSAAAVAWCADNAPRFDAHVIAVLAEEPFLEWVTDDDPKSWRRQAEQHVDTWVAPLRDRGVAVETRIVRDIHPAAAIAQTARRREADLVVVGARPPASIVATHHRGVATQVVHQAQLPVVLVPGGESS